MDGDDREIIKLRLFDDLNFKDLAEALQCTEDAARMRHNRALGRLAIRVRELRRGSLSEILESDFL